MPRSNSALRRIMRAEKAPYLEDWPEKQECREMLIAAAEKAPATAFSLCGMGATCVEQWRAMWSQTRVVCVDKAATVARFTEAEKHPRRIGHRTFPNEIFSTTLMNYAVRRAPLCQLVNGEKVFRSDFDFPKFDLMFLDTTNHCDNKAEREAIIRMMNNHSAPTAVIGVTMASGVTGAVMERWRCATEIAETMLVDINRPCRIVGAKDYVTRGAMSFWIFRLGGS